MDKGELVGTIGFLLGLLFLLVIGSFFSGCYYYDEQAYLAGYHDGQLVAAEEIEDLEDEVHDLQWKLSACLYPQGE